MARDGSILFRFLGDIRDLTRKTKQVENEVAGTSKRAASVFSNNFSKITDEIGARFGRVGQEAAAALNVAADNAVTAGSAIGTGVAAGAAVAGAALVGAGIRGVAVFKDLASQVRAFQRVSGASAEEASRLVAIMRALNVDTTAGGRAMFMLSKNIDGNAKKLQEHGIQIARNEDGTVNLTKTLFNVVDAYRAAGKGAEGNAIAAAAFGRAGMSLLPILTATRDRLEEIDAAASRHHEWMTQDQIDAAKEMGIAQTELSHAIQGVEIELGQGLVPAMTLTARIMTRLTEIADKVVGPLGGIGGAIDKTIKAMIPGGGATTRFIGKLFGAGDAAEEAADKTGTLTEGLDDQGDAADDAASSLDGLTDSTKLYTSALDATLGAHLNARAAARSLSDAEADLADALGRGGDKADESTGKIRTYQDALHDIFDAIVEVDEAHDDAADAVDRLRKAMGKAGVGSEDAAAFMERWAQGGQQATDSLREIRGALRGAVKAAEQEVDAMAESGQIADTAEARKAALRDRLLDLRNQFPALAGDIDRYIGALSRVPNLTTDASTETKKLSDSKKDLAGSTDSVIEAARREADQQDTVVGKYQKMLELLEGLKAKYPEVAGAIQQAIDDTNAAIARFWHDPNNKSLGGALTRDAQDRAKQWAAQRSGGTGPLADLGRTLMETAPRIVNNSVKVDVHGLDTNAAGDVIARKIVFAIGRK